MVARCTTVATDMAKESVLLTTPVTKETQTRVHEIAKENGMPVRVFSRLIFEHAVADYENGDLEITKPSVRRAETKEGKQ